jgi:hypothetical protein
MASADVSHKCVAKLQMYVASSENIIDAWNTLNDSPGSLDELLGF